MHSEYTRSNYEELAQRIGDPAGRISSVQECLDFERKTTWLVTVPLNDPQDTLEVYSDSFVVEWRMGQLYAGDGSLIQYNAGALDEIYVVENKAKNTEKGIEYRYMISLLTYNIIPNNRSSHAIFKTYESARDYRVWLNMRYRSAESLDNVGSLKIIEGIRVDWNEFINGGLEYKEVES